MTVDTSRTLEIESSPAKLLTLLGLGVLMTAGAITVALLPNVPAHSRIIGGYFGSVFFGLCTGMALWRAITVTVHSIA